MQTDDRWTPTLLRTTEDAVDEMAAAHPTPPAASRPEVDENDGPADGQPQTALDPERQPSDLAVRLRALDPAASFLVQAPAGSGKTELLTDRILALLATVERPEEILAITFTRKAAAEMHERVLSKLRAGLGPPPQETFRQRSWRLAHAAMQRDAAMGWQLLRHPVRLSIRTIDAYCAQLVRAMPWLSGMGGTPAITDDPQDCYREAARATLAMMDDTPSVAELVAHLDVDLRIAESLIAGMLASRDQWLPLLQEGSRMDVLAEHLASAVSRDLQHLLRAMPLGWAHALSVPLRQAAQVLDDSQPSHALSELLDWDGEPFAPEAEDIPRWRALADALLTQKGELRRTVTKTLGFTAKSPHKQAFMDWLEAADPTAAWVGLLDQARSLPAGYDEAQERTLQVLLEVLWFAAAQLRLCFSARGEVDFIEIAQRATQALGTAEDPGELLLALDARVRHILVDEFQDTSQSQIDLLRTLTSGWQQGDGRTLFLVGDPMQSIYRFRKAEVGWFLRVQAQGLGEVPLQALRLTDNFRSQAQVVDWVNQVFAPLFPQRDDPALGAIRYTPSRAFRPPREGLAVEAHPIWRLDEAPDDAAQAAQSLAVHLARDALARHPDGDHPVTILVRARPHLDGIVRRLAQAGIPCRAVELATLRSRQVVGDLAQLARALSHPADRLAWLSVLRSPLCGLRLHTLHAIAGHDLQATVPVLLDRWLWCHDPELRGAAAPARADDLPVPALPEALQPEEMQRVRHAAAVLRDASNAAGTVPFAAWLSRCWNRLGGPLAYPQASDRDDVEQVFRLIEQMAPFGGLDLAQFEARLDTLYAAPSSAGRAVEVMTIHKAKGLEFDTVILAGLHRRPRPDGQPLVRFEQSEGELLLGPIAHRVSDAPDPVSAYLARREQQRSRYEADRLLYVAATRARQRLHLIGIVDVDAAGVPKPPAPASMLGRLWEHMQMPSPPSLQELQGSAATSPQHAQAPGLKRLALAHLPGAELPPPAAAPGASWQWQADSSLERLSGTVAHAWLEHMGGDAHAWTPQRLQAHAPVMRRQLGRAGLAQAQLDAGVALVQETLAGTLASERGRWLLDQAQARREWALLDAEGRVSVIDLAVSDAQGWLVVDYKTGAPQAGEDAQAFAARMRERYAAQILRYCEQVSRLDGRAARGALYFPRADLWLTVAP